MIRDKRAWLAVNVIGAMAALSVVVLQCLYPSTHPLLHWLTIANGAVLFALFVYNIVLRMRGPIQPARWARNMSDGQLWIVKGIVTVSVAGIATALALHVLQR